jgi:hypothetical protein
MTVCPVCEHQQAQGSECEVCGKRFGSSKVAELPVTALPELERTAFGAAPVVGVTALPELEATRLAAGPDLPLVRLVDVEGTALAPVGEVAVERLPEVDLGRYVDTGPRTPLSLTRVCRYCKNTQAEGLTCDRCGMLLPSAALEASEPAASRPGEEEIIKCPQCGSRVAVGQVCGGCGILA